MGFLTTLFSFAAAGLYGLTAFQIAMFIRLFRSSIETKARQTIFFGALLLVIVEALIIVPVAMGWQNFMQEKIAWGVIDTKGNFVVQPNETQSSHHADSSDFLSNKQGLNGDPQLYEYHDGSQFGNEHSIVDGNLSKLPYSEGLSLAKSISESSWGFVDKANNFVIPNESFDDARSFKEGLAAAAIRLSDYNGERCSVGTSGRLWWGYIDHKGTWAIKPQFARAESFRDGLACVGVFLAQKDPNSNNDIVRFGYIDKTGKFVIPPIFNYANSFYQGKADVAVNTNDHSLSKKTPKLVSPPNVVDGVRPEAANSGIDWARRQVASWRTGGGSSLVDERDCNAWLRRKPDDAEIMAVRAIVRCGNYPIKMDEIEKDAKQALSIDPKCALAYGVLGHLFDIKQKYAEAAKQFSKAIELEPKNAEWYASRGLVYEGLEDYKKAIADYTKQLELEPESEWGLGERAHAYLSLNQYNPQATDIELALKDINKVLKLNPNNTYALKQHADASYKKGQYAQGVTDLEKAESLLDPHSPELVEILDMQAHYYEKVGKKDKSKSARKRCTALCNQINGTAGKSK